MYLYLQKFTLFNATLLRCNIFFRVSEWLHTSCVYSTNTIFRMHCLCSVCTHAHTPLERGGVSRCLCACVVVWEEGHQSRFFQGSNSEYIARKIIARNKASWIHDLRPPEGHPPAQMNLSDTVIRTLTNLQTHTHTQPHTHPTPQPIQPAPASPRTHATTTCSNQ